MDITLIKNSFRIIFGKYKYAIIVLLVGATLMLFPDLKTDEAPETSEQELTIELSVEQQLEELLSFVDGAGAVKVLLTEKVGKETVYQCDEDKTESDASASVRMDTVTVTDAQRNESGLIRQINPPQYMGAIILCQGAEDPSVRLSISNAVSKITGLGTDKIAVLKMK